MAVSTISMGHVGHISAWVGNAFVPFEGTLSINQEITND